MPTPWPQPGPLIAKVVTGTVAGTVCADAPATKASVTRRKAERRRGMGKPRPRLADLAEAVRVLLPVVLGKLAGLDRLPPASVRAVPLDRLRQAFLERAPSPPAEPLELRGVERIAAVMAEPVVDVADEGWVGPGQLDDQPGDVQVLALLPADVVDLARPALAQDELDRGTVIVHVHPLAPLPAVAVDGELEAVERVRDEER